MKSLLETVLAVKKRLIEMHYHANAGHVGGNLSSLEIMTVLFHTIMKENDRFILSKGHSAGLLYCVLWSLGLLSEEELATFAQDNTRLAGHPSAFVALPFVCFSTGSLGHGPSLAAGLALAAKHKGIDRHIYCLCSDGEWQEGSCWEALMFAVHQKLNHLTIIIDQNGLQGFGRLEEIVSISDWTSRIAAFGAHTIQTDGHDVDALRYALSQKSVDMPTVCLCTTKKGYLTSKEGTVSSHYLPLSNEDYLNFSKHLR